MSEPNGTLAILAEIAVERARQVTEEGWTPEHDDQQQQGELAIAAAAYAEHAGRFDDGPGYTSTEPRRLPARWPWAWSWWKPQNRRRDLVRAAALIVAEIERIDRAEGRS